MRFNHGTPAQVRTAVAFILLAVLPVPGLIHMVKSLDIMMFGVLPIFLFIMAFATRSLIHALFEEIEVQEEGIQVLWFGRPKKTIRWEQLEIVRIYEKAFIQLFLRGVRRTFSWQFQSELQNKIRERLLPDTVVIEHRTEFLD